ncbi:hypothetical protein [Catenulispora sp. MAP12-49]|uniref:effector-associated constant component EACC1 n=1 Tax=Catenulispora sp. MAP12-49 TaxID=3156302 RepID=UPI003517B2EA
MSTAAESDLWNLAETLSRDPDILRVEPFPGRPRPPTANDPGSGLRAIRVVISDSLDQEELARLIAQWRLARPGLPKVDS